MEKLKVSLLKMKKTWMKNRTQRKKMTNLENPTLAVKGVFSHGKVQKIPTFITENRVIKNKCHVFSFSLVLSLRFPKGIVNLGQMSDG